MRRPFVYNLWRVLIGLALVVGFPFAVSGQKYVETLEYLRMSIDASGLAYDKLEETEAYVVSVAKSLSGKEHSTNVSDLDLMNLRKACDKMEGLVRESLDLIGQTLCVTEDAEREVDAESCSESWEQVASAKAKFEKAVDLLRRGCHEFELAQDQDNFDSLLNYVKQGVQHLMLGKTCHEEGEEALRSSAKWLQ